MSYTKPAAYNQFMGRWSARLAPLFLRFSQIREGQNVLDVGSGTGSLSRAVVDFAGDTKVMGVDPAPSYVAFAQDAVSSPRATFRVGSGEHLEFADGTFDAALALLVVQDFNEPAQAVSEMARVTRKDGVVAGCMWDFGQGLPMLSLIWQAAETVAPGSSAAHRPKTSIRYASVRDLEELWKKGSLTEIAFETIELAMPFQSFEDYWKPFLEGSTPVSAFAAALEEQTNGMFSRVLRESIKGMQPDGSFVLPARAWAIRGISLG